MILSYQFNKWMGTRTTAMCVDSNLAGAAAFLIEQFKISHASKYSVRSTCHIIVIITEMFVPVLMIICSSHRQVLIVSYEVSGLIAWLLFFLS